MAFFRKLVGLFKDKQGSTAVEFALVMPVVVMATLMIFDLGRVMLAYSSVNDVASDTARYASIHGPARGGGLSDDEIVVYAESQIAGLELALIETTITWSANKARGSIVTVRISSGFEFFVTRFIPIDAFSIDTEGITGITPLDIDFASEFGYKIKLLAITKQDGNDIEIRVHPTMIPNDNLISSVNGVFNAIHVDADATGTGLYYGRGAGELPTGSAVVSDIIDIARNIKSGVAERFQDIGIIENKKLKVRKMEDIRTSYYLRFSVKDRPGVLSAISGILGKHNISIESMIQKGRETKKAVTVVMMTHEAKEKDMVTALKEINKLSDISGKTMFLRVEGGEA